MKLKRDVQKPKVYDQFVKRSKPDEIVFRKS
jgi:hypothetical protein